MRRLSAVAGLLAFGTSCACAQDVAHPLHIGGDVKAPVLIYQVNPDTRRVPKAERKLNHGVSAYMIVDQEGRPQQIRLSKSNTPELDAAVLQAMRQYRFRPATRNGVPVAVDLYVETNIDFF